jgi:hypothetical protein
LQWRENLKKAAFESPFGSDEEFNTDEISSGGEEELHTEGTEIDSTIDEGELATQEAQLKGELIDILQKLKEPTPSKPPLLPKTGIKVVSPSVSSKEPVKLVKAGSGTPSKLPARRYSLSKSSLPSSFDEPPAITPALPSPTKTSPRRSSVSSSNKNTPPKLTPVKKIAKDDNNNNNSPKEKPPPSKVSDYKVAKGDPVDELLFKLFESLGFDELPFPIKRLGGGKYVFGTMKVYLRNLNGKLIARVGGGWEPLETFILKYKTTNTTKATERAADGSVWAGSITVSRVRSTQNTPDKSHNS